MFVKGAKFPKRGPNFLGNLAPRGPYFLGNLARGGPNFRGGQISCDTGTKTLAFQKRNSFRSFKSFKSISELHSITGVDSIKHEICFLTCI